MKAIFFSLVVFVICQPTFSQVSGKLTDAAGHSIPYATVSLLKASDSTLIRSALSSEMGDYKLDNVNPGQYILRLSSVGHRTLYTPVFELTTVQPSRDVGTQVLGENGKHLGEVVIRPDRPLLQQRADGTIVNVERSVMTRGSSALEVLERSPGVVIDHQNNGIVLNGKSGVMVMLNGKLLRMALDQVVIMLGGMSANDITRIELLTSPSAAYDAEGSAGLINIITRKNSRPGTNGSISFTAGNGYGEKGTGSLSLNHHSGETNIYGSYSFSHDRTYSDFHATGSEQEPLLGGLATSDFLSTAKPVLNNHQAIFGVDTKPNKSLAIGGSLNYDNSSTAIQTVNHGMYLIQPDSVYRLNAVINGVNRWRNVTSGLYAEQQLRPGEKILLNLDYIDYKNGYPIGVQSSFLNRKGRQVSNNDTLFSPLLKGLSTTLIRVWAPKADYTRQFNSRIILDAGLKGTWTRTVSTSAIQSLVNGAYVSRPSAINNIVMKEGIGAAYTSLRAKLDTSTELLAGLRYEYSDTRMDNPIKGENIADRRLGMLFPSLLLSKKLSNGAEWLLSYSRRISRPSYADLASYVTYNGPSSVNTGNPLLRPTITDNLKLNYNYKSYSFSALLSRDDNPIARNQIVYTTDKMQMAVSPQNLVYQDNLTFQANLPFSVGHWWSMSYDLIGGWHRFKLNYTPQPAEKTYFAYNLHTSQIFTLPAKFSIELSGYYNSAFYNGSRKVDGYGVLNAGIKKDLKNDRGSFQLAVSDPLRTNVISSYFGALTQEAFDLKTHVDFHTESGKYLFIKLSYSRSFGSLPTAGQRKGDNGSPGENERMGH